MSKPESRGAGMTKSELRNPNGLFVIRTSTFVIRPRSAFRVSGCAPRLALDQTGRLRRIRGPAPATQVGVRNTLPPSTPAREDRRDRDRSVCPRARRAPIPSRPASFSRRSSMPIRSSRRCSWRRTRHGHLRLRPGPADRSFGADLRPAGRSPTATTGSAVRWAGRIRSIRGWRSAPWYRSRIASDGRLASTRHFCPTKE